MSTQPRSAQPVSIAQIYGEIKVALLQTVQTTTMGVNMAHTAVSLADEQTSSWASKVRKRRELDTDTELQAIEKEREQLKLSN